MKRQQTNPGRSDDVLGRRVERSQLGPLRFVIRSAEAVKAPKNRDVASRRAAGAMARLRLG
jgi:hypothetical protein